MNSLYDLMKRLSSIGQVTEAEEKCSECGCTPCECDDKDKVDEAAKPDADSKLPSMAHIKEMCEDGMSVAEICKMHPDCDQTKLKEMISDCKNKLDEGSKPDFLDMDKDGDKKESMKDAVADKKDDDKEEDVKESALNLLRRYAGMPSVQEGAMDSLKALGKKTMDTLGHKDDEELIKDMQKQQGMPQTGKKPSEEKIEETALNLLRKYAGIQETKIEEDDVEEGNEFSGALKAARDSGKEEFEVAGKKYKVNECGEDYPSSGQMSPMTMTGQEQPHMGIPAEVMAQMAAPEMSEPEGPHMEVPMAAEEPKATYTLNIQNGENNLSMTTDMPDEIIHIMKLAGVNKGAEVSKKEMPADGEEVEESGYENTPDNTRARDPQAHGDIRDWGQKGTAKASTHYTPAQSGDNPMNEQRMFQDYKNFKAGK